MQKNDTEWPTLTLDDLGEFTKGAGISKADLVENGLPCIRYGELYTTHDYVIREFNSFIAPEVATRSKRIFVGDILFAGSGETLEEIGKCAAFVGKEKAYAGGDIIILRTNKGDPTFLGYLLNHETVNRQKHRLGQGQSVVHIYARFLKDIEIPFPPEDEQRKIAEILESSIEAIRQTKELIEAKRLHKKGLMQGLLTGKIRFPEFVQTTGMVATKVGQRPVDWQETVLGSIIEEYKKRSIIENEHHVMTSSNKGLVLQTDYYKGTRIGNKSNVGFNILPEGYITYRSRSDVSDFTFNLNTLGFPGLVSTYYPVFTFANGNNWFFVEFLNYHRHHIGKYSVGTSQTVLSLNQLKELSLRVPSFPEQQMIASIVKLCNEEIELLEHTMATLILQKNGLMQHLLSGKIRVKV